LVVDDDCAIRMLVKALLETEGYAVLIAADAETALKLFDSSTVALLLTDVVMPDMNGPELADQLLRREPQLPILFMSGSEDASRGFGCVAKPFTGAGLIRRVGEVLQSAAQAG
jgi:two-component system cell cycle sensor histidine kinase/response regulator CckA